MGHTLKIKILKIRLRHVLSRPNLCPEPKKYINTTNFRGKYRLRDFLIRIDIFPNVFFKQTNNEIEIKSDKLLDSSITIEAKLLNIKM